VTRSTSRRRTVLASLATLSLLTACSSPVGGNPSAVSSPPASSGSSTSNSEGGDPFASLSPCTLLDQALKEEGFPPAAPSSGDPKHACSFNKPPFGTVGLSLQANRGLDDNIDDPSKGRTGDVNGRTSIEVRERLGDKGACEIFMKIEPNSRAILVVNLVSRDTAEACTYAGQAATKIEPLLPK
jgi:hypothetical protein